MVISMDRWRGKVAIVTGASSGIGAGIAEHLVILGLKVVGMARRKERVEELAKKLEGKSGKLYALKGDVTKEEDIIQSFKWVEDHIGPIHILINNAGVVRRNGLLDGETRFWKEVLDTNVLGLCIATREAAKYMKENKIAGHIIHINSIAGHTVVPFPNMNVYPASKFAVTALTETLRQELNFIGSQIKITSISPGYVRSEIISAGGMVTPAELLGIQEDIPILAEEDIADAVIYVLGTPPHVQIHEIIIKPVGEKM